VGKRADHFNSHSTFPLSSASLCTWPEYGDTGVLSLSCVFSLADKLLKKVEYLEKNAKVYRGMSYVILLSHLPASSFWLLVYTILQAIKTGGGRGLGMRICVMCYSSTCSSCQCIFSNNLIMNALRQFFTSCYLSPSSSSQQCIFQAVSLINYSVGWHSSCSGASNHTGALCDVYDLPTSVHNWSVTRKTLHDHTKAPGNGGSTVYTLSANYIYSSSKTEEWSKKQHASHSITYCSVVQTLDAILLFGSSDLYVVVWSVMIR